MATIFLENGSTPRSFFCTGILQWLRDCNDDERINSGDDSSTSDKNLVSVGPVIRKLRG